MSSRQNSQPAASAGANGAWVPRPLTPLQLQQLEDLRWAGNNPEVQTHHGKYVVVHKKRIVAVGDDRVALVQQAAAQEQCPSWELAVEVVPAIDIFEATPST